MKNVNVRYVFDRVNATGYRKKEKGKEYKEKGLLQVEVRKIGTSNKVFISTNIYIKPDQFSSENGFTCKNHKFALKITSEGRNIFNKVFEFVTSDICRGLEDVKKWNSSDNNSSFLSFYNEILKEKSLTLSLNTIKHHLSLEKRLKAFGRLCSFNDLTYENIIKFDVFLKKENLAQTSVYKNHSVLRSYIQEAVNRDYIKYSPYNRFQPKKGRGEETVFLNDDEIKKIQEKDFSGSVDDKLQKTKDMFLFQCFTGLSYVDMASFKKDNILKVEGHDVIRGFRGKTKEQYVIFLLPEAREILEKYNYELPIISNQKYNDYLKLVASNAGINKHITSHVGRHTFATYLLNKGVPIESVSVAMGHTNIKQTQVYARMLSSTSVRDIANILGKKIK